MALQQARGAQAPYAARFWRAGSGWLLTLLLCAAWIWSPAAHAAITLSPTTVPGATVGSAYGQTITASGGIGGYDFDITAGALPPGIALSAGGVLSGTPTASGSFSFTITATDENPVPESGSQAYTLVVANIPPVANPVSATVAYNSGANPITLNITGGAPNSVAVGTAAAHGTAIASGLTITYQPNAGFAGTDTFTYTATNGAGTSAPATVTVTVTNPIIVVTASGPFVAQVGVPYSQTFTWSGGTAPYSSYNVAGLPAGLAIASNTADSVTVSGTPTVAGSFGLNASAKDSSTGNGPFTQGQIFTLTVNPPPGPPIANAVSATVAYGSGANAITLNITGDAATSVSVPSAPAHGTAIASGTSITYQPNAGYAGPDSFTYDATNVHGTSVPATVTILVANPIITVTASAPLTAQIGVPYSQTFTWSGGAAPYSSYNVAGLPAGLAIASNTADSVTVSGTPTAAGSFGLNASAKDSSTGNGPFTQGQIFTLTVNAPTLSMTPAAGTLPLTYGAPNTVNFSASGGTAAYSYSLSSGALPVGVSLSSVGVLSGTPTVPGNYNISVRVEDNSTGAGAPFSLSQNYVLQVGTPAIAITPANMPDGTVGTPYSVALTASGGAGPYTFSLSSGALPVGMSFSSGGMFSGTPRSDGSFSLTVQATDSHGQIGSRAYTFTIAPPTLTITPPSLPGGTPGIPYSATLATSGGIAPYTYAIVSGALPIGVSFSSAGVLSGTPAVAGSYTANVRSTDDAGYNTTVAYTIVIAVPPLPVPQGQPQTATTLSGQAVTLDAANGATGGPFTGVTIVAPPASGTVVVTGTQIVYTPAADTVGAIAIGYTLNNAFGASATITSTVTVNPVPVAVSSHVETTADTPVHVNLTTGASGGPFTAATLVSLSPASSGTATISGSAGAYELTFVPATGFAGLATVTFTLSNAFAVSAPATVEIQVIGRSDPSKDPEVIGLLEAQASAARRFANSQIGNFQQRMENMHGESENRGGFQNRISFAGQQHCSPNSRRAYEDPECAQTALRDEDAPMAAPAPMQNGESSRNPLGFWGGGSISRGDRDPRTGVTGFDFETSGVSAGGDVRLSPDFALGGGIGYGRDDTDIGGSGTRSESDAYTVAMYASYHPGEHFYLDGLLGYQWLSFDNRRFVTDTGGLVRGERDGKQWLASLAAGMDYRSDRVTFSPYARLDVARARLDGYTEQGDPTHALAFRRQDVDTTTGNLGFRLDYRNDLSWATFSPQLRLELQHEFEDDGSATMSYADFPAGPLYRALVRDVDRSRTIFGLGFALQTNHDLHLRVEFRTLFDGEGESDNGVLLNLEKKY